MVQPAYESYECLIDINNEPTQVSIYDTFGQDDFSPTRDLIFSKVSAILLCYSIISPTSFDNITAKVCWFKTWKTELDFPLVVTRDQTQQSKV